MAKYYYTDKKYKELLQHMVILHDTQEKSSQHIIEYFDKNKIKHEAKSLKTGDYSFKIEKCPELGFNMDTYFTDELCIERKNSLTEIAGNLTEESQRFSKQLNRMKNIENCYLIIENDSISNLMNHKYDTKYNEDSFLRTILTWQKRVGFYLYFSDKDLMGKLIYELCKNTLDTTILK